MDKDEALARVGSYRRRLLRAREVQLRARHDLEIAVVEAASAGATQRETALQAAVSQPYVARIVARHSRRFAPSSPLGRRLVERRDDVLAVLDAYGADNARVFGSVARGEDRPDSDIDLIVDVAPGTGLFTIGRMEQALEQLLEVDVDLIPGRLIDLDVAGSAWHDVVKL